MSLIDSPEYDPDCNLRLYIFPTSGMGMPASYDLFDGSPEAVREQIAEALGFEPETICLSKELTPVDLGFPFAGTHIALHMHSFLWAGPRGLDEPHWGKAGYYLLSVLDNDA